MLVNVKKNYRDIKTFLDNACIWCILRLSLICIIIYHSNTCKIYQCIGLQINLQNISSLGAVSSRNKLYQQEIVPYQIPSYQDLKEKKLPTFDLVRNYYMQSDGKKNDTLSHCHKIKMAIKNHLRLKLVKNHYYIV